MKLDRGGFIRSTGCRGPRPAGVYAAGDCTGVLMLASVAAMQGRIAMWHTLGDAVSPLDLKTVSSNVFTAPEIATVGVTQQQVDSGEVPARVGHPAADAATPGPRCRAPRRLRQAVLPQRHRHRDRRRGGRAAGQRADLPDRRSRSPSG